MGTTTYESTMLMPPFITDNTGTSSQGLFCTKPVSMLHATANYHFILILILLRRRDFYFLALPVCHRLPSHSLYSHGSKPSPTRFHLPRAMRL